MEVINKFDEIVIKKSHNKYVVIVQGFAFEKKREKFILSLYVNNQEMQISHTIQLRKDISKKYSKYTPKARCGFRLQSQIFELDNLNCIKIVARKNDEIINLIEMNQKRILKHIDENNLQYHFDDIVIDEKKESVLVRGFAFSYFSSKTISLSVLDEKGNEVTSNFQFNDRVDLFEHGMIPKDCVAGFTLRVEFKEKLFLRIASDDETKTVAISKNEYNDHLSYRIFKKINVQNIVKAFRYFKKHGVKELIKRLIRKSNVFGIPYETWYNLHKICPETYDKQCKTKFSYEPLISIIVPTFNTPLNFLREMIDSVISQSYSNWELCIADGSTQQDVIDVIKAYATKDMRVKYTLLDKNYGIAGNTNKALEMATGVYVGLFDHDDLLTSDCLFEIVSSLQDVKHDIIYTDEDKTDSATKNFKEPNFKPDYNVDLFYSHNYITHFFIVKRSIINKVGGFQSEYDGAQDYDIMFRCIEQSTTIHHIPKILYHWRMHEASTAANPESKMYCYEAGKRAIDDHFKRIGLNAEAEVLNLWGLYRIHYKILNNPLISIIIPNKDNMQLLKNCIESLYEVNEYQNFEIIIIENNSEIQETFLLYKELEREHSNIKVVYWDKEFNYSSINNFGVSFAKGEYLLLLNNDTEAIYNNSISEMLGLCMRKDVGVVGAKLLYPNDTVQHAGIVLGVGGFCDHVFRNVDAEEVGYMARARINCDYSAVTAACMMVKKSIYDEVSGFSEEFKVGLNDIDFCLKVRRLHKLVVYNAFSIWYHYESITRGYEDTLEKRERFHNEINLFKEKWKKELSDGDPYYNKNFITDEKTGPFKLR